MPTFSQDAKCLSLLFDYGTVTGCEIIRWADSQIAALDRVPDHLLQLALASPDNTAEIISCLHTLSKDEPLWPAFRTALGRLHGYILTRPDEAERIANCLFLTVVSQGGVVPSEFQFAYRFDDAFYLVRDGSYGTEESVRRDFSEELIKFKSSS